MHHGHTVCNKRIREWVICSLICLILAITTEISFIQITFMKRNALWAQKVRNQRQWQEILCLPIFLVSIVIFLCFASKQHSLTSKNDGAHSWLKLYQLHEHCDPCFCFVLHIQPTYLLALLCLIFVSGTAKTIQEASDLRDHLSYFHLLPSYCTLARKHCIE